MKGSPHLFLGRITLSFFMKDTSNFLQLLYTNTQESFTAFHEIFSLKNELHQKK